MDRSVPSIPGIASGGWGEVGIHLHDRSPTVRQRTRQPRHVRATQALLPRPIRTWTRPPFEPELLGDGAGAIGAVVVHNEHGQFRQGQCEEALHKARQIRGLVVRRDDDGYPPVPHGSGNTTGEASAPSVSSSCSRPSVLAFHNDSRDPHSQAASCRPGPTLPDPRGVPRSARHAGAAFSRLGWPAPIPTLATGGAARSAAC